MTRQRIPAHDAHHDRSGHRRAEQAAATLAAGALLTGCGTAQLPADTPAPAGTATSTQSTVPTATSTPSSSVGTRVVASTFPELAGYRWEELPADEWAQAWKVYSSDFHGTLAGGDGRQVFDDDGKFVGIVVVLTPTPENSSPAALKRIFDQQKKQTTETYGVASVLEMPGHDVLAFADSADQTNWYWVSGEEFVVVITPDAEDDSWDFFELLCNNTL